jgi:hypothetical protein
MVCFPPRLPSTFLMGADFSARRFLWHYIRPSILPDLSRTYARSVLETAIVVRLYVAVSVTTQRNGQ